MLTMTPVPIQKTAITSLLRSGRRMDIPALPKTVANAGATTKLARDNTTRNGSKGVLRSISNENLHEFQKVRTNTYFLMDLALMNDGLYFPKVDKHRFEFQKF